METATIVAEELLRLPEFEDVFIFETKYSIERKGFYKISSCNEDRCDTACILSGDFFLSYAPK